MSVLVLQSVAYANDDMFNKMESSKTFDKIRMNFVASCYVKGNPTPTKNIDLDTLKTQNPHRVEACTCFENELSKVPNRTIFDDSKRAYQFYQEKSLAMKNNDTEQLKKLAEQEKAYKPFMTVVIKKCGLNK